MDKDKLNSVNNTISNYQPLFHLVETPDVYRGDKAYFTIPARFSVADLMFSSYDDTKQKLLSSIWDEISLSSTDPVPGWLAENAEHLYNDTEQRDLPADSCLFIGRMPAYQMCHVVDPLIDDEHIQVENRNVGHGELCVSVMCVVHMDKLFYQLDGLIGTNGSRDYIKTLNALAALYPKDNVDTVVDPDTEQECYKIKWGCLGEDWKPMDTASLLKEIRKGAKAVMMDNPSESKNIDALLDHAGACELYSYGYPGGEVKLLADVKDDAGKDHTILFDMPQLMHDILFNHTNSFVSLVPMLEDLREDIQKRSDYRNGRDEPEDLTRAQEIMVKNDDEVSLGD